MAGGGRPGSGSGAEDLLVAVVRDLPSGAGNGSSGDVWPGPDPPGQPADAGHLPAQQSRHTAALDRGTAEAQAGVLDAGDESELRAGGPGGEVSGVAEVGRHQGNRMAVGAEELEKVE